MSDDEKGYGSRKFIVTMSAMALGFVAAYLKILTPELGFVLAGGIAAYNWANVEWQKSQAMRATAAVQPPKPRDLDAL